MRLPMFRKRRASQKTTALPARDSAAARLADRSRAAAAGGKDGTSPQTASGLPIEPTQAPKSTMSVQKGPTITYESIAPPAYLPILQLWMLEARYEPLPVDHPSVVMLYSQPSVHGRSGYLDSTLILHRVIQGTWNGQGATFISMEVQHPRHAHHSMSYIGVKVLPVSETAREPIIVAHGPRQVEAVPITVDLETGAEGTAEVQGGFPSGLASLSAALSANLKLKTQLTRWPTLSSALTMKGNKMRCQVNRGLMGHGIPPLFSVGIVVLHHGNKFRVEAKAHPDEASRVFTPRRNGLTPLIVDPNFERSPVFLCDRAGCGQECRRLDFDHFSQAMWRRELNGQQVLGYENVAWVWGGAPTGERAEGRAAPESSSTNRASQALTPTTAPALASGSGQVVA